MKITIDKNFVENFKGAKGQTDFTLYELKKFAGYLDSKRCKIIIMGSQCFVVFAEAIDAEIIVSDYRKISDLDFLNDSNSQVIEASKKDGNYRKFLIDEFIQGLGLKAKVFRLMRLLVPIIVLNAIGLYYANESGIGGVFAGLLTAVSIFVAIFSLFITNNDYMNRNKVSLFESGTLSYYFSIDRYITITGICAIVMSIFALMITSSFQAGHDLYTLKPKNLIVIMLLNLIFTAVYIILRSMVEFYIIRPGKFILADRKNDSFNEYRDMLKAE